MLNSVSRLLDESSRLARMRGLGASPERVHEAFKLFHSSQVDTLGMVGRALSDGETLKEIARGLSYRRAEEETERAAVLGAIRSVLDNKELTRTHALFWGLRNYFESLPLTGKGPAAEVMARAIARALREPESLMARGEMAHAAVLSLRAMKRSARLIANEYAATLYARSGRRAG